MRLKSKTNNLLLVAVFAICVLFLVGASLILKFIGIIKLSTFDGEHRFTVFVSDQSGSSAYVSVDPSQNSTSKLVLKDKVDRDQAILSLPIAVDGVVVLSGRFDPNDSITALLWSMLVKRNSVRKNITGIDLLRMYFFAKATPLENIYLEEARVLPDSQNEVAFTELFSDQVLVQDDKTIAIENATLKSGVGSRVEEVLLVMGANVISVETAVVKVKQSKIIYYERPTYTTLILAKLLNYPLEKSDRLGISDISIIIGEDGFNNLVLGE